MINLSWLVRKRKLRLTLEAIWVTTTSLTLSSHVTMETFFYCINELSYLTWGRKLYGPACTSPSIYPTEKLSQVWCRGKRHCPILQGEKRAGEESLQALHVQLAQKAGANRQHVFLRPTCHQGDQTARGPRAMSTLKGLSTKHFIAAEQKDQEAGDPGITTLGFSSHIQQCHQLHHWWGQTSKIPAKDSLEGAVTPQHTCDRPQQGPTLAEILWWRKRTPRYILLFRACFESCLEKTCWPTSGCEQKEDSWH